jgi:hypothetical protein
VHADDGDGLHALRSADVFEVNHRLAAVRVALRARLNTGLTTDAAVRIDEKVQVVGLGHEPLRGYCCGSNEAAWSCGPSARRTRHPHTLYWGILLIGSWAATVSWLALLRPAQW